MALEQFEGKEADARADIWAFGAMLYEMVTGQKAFQGKSYASLVGAILAAEPPPMSVKPFTPSWLERLVRWCLAKDPEALAVDARCRAGLAHAAGRSYFRTNVKRPPTLAERRGCWYCARRFGRRRMDV